MAHHVVALQELRHGLLVFENEMVGAPFNFHMKNYYYYRCFLHQNLWETGQVPTELRTVGRGAKGLFFVLAFLWVAYLVVFVC